MTSKPKPKPALTVVDPAGPDLAQLERELVEAAEHTVPPVSRAETKRRREEAEETALRAELDVVEGKIAFVNRVYEKLVLELNAERADIIATLGMTSACLTQDKLAAAE